MFRRRFRRAVIALTALALVAAACGDDDAATTTTAAATTTTAAETTTTTAATTTTTAPPETTTTTAGAEPAADVSRIVSLSGDITEILFELGLGDNVVAVDVTTTYPPEAADLPVIGFGQDLAPEPVLGMQPTVVFGNEMTGPPEVVEQIQGAGVTYEVFPTGTTLDEAVQKIRDVADYVGRPEEGEALAARVQAEIDEAVALAESVDRDPRVAFLYSRGPQVLFLFGVGTATNAMITNAGAVDAAAETGVFGAAPLTPEALAAAAPEVIVVPEGGLGALGGPPGLLELPGVAQTPAGQEGNFLSYDEAYFFNLGPRVGQALQEFVRDLYPELGDG